MNREGMLKPAVVGGVLLGILSSLPVISRFNCVCCAWVIGGGVLAAYLYVKDSAAAVTLGRGAALGLLAGLIGTAVIAVFSIPLYLIAAKGGLGLEEQLKQAMDQIPSFPRESREMLTALFAREGFLVVFYAMGLLFLLVTNCVMAALGGTLGVALFEKRSSGSAKSGPPTYEPPASIPPPPSPPDAPQG
jgi:hypothetical protein